MVECAYVGYSHHLPTGINNFFPWTQSWEDEYKKRMNDPDRSYLEWELDASGAAHCHDGAGRCRAAHSLRYVRRGGWRPEAGPGLCRYGRE